jgi:hypothetical protein
MYKKTIAVTISAVFSSFAIGQVGVGVAFQGGDEAIYLPIDVSDNFRIEPSLRYSRYNDKTTYESSSESSSLSKYTSESEVVSLGVGFFRMKKLAENFGFYSGVRIGYLYSEQKRERPSSDDYNGYSKGFSFSPAAGFEYFIVDNLSVGGEIAVHYSNMDGNSDDYGVDSDSSSTNTSTGTSMSARFYF